MELETHSQPSRPAADISQFYDDEFYASQLALSLRSARIYLSLLWRHFQPRSVLDVGCGRGAWLKACHELGSTRLLGLDGSWNSPSLLIDGAIEFTSVDLDKPFSVSPSVELAMSLEVAEHLLPTSSRQFVKCLTDASNIVLFSAAYPGQGGNNHINEQPHSYWAELFAANGFMPIDLFRPAFWGNEEVCFWYRQNAFLYVKSGSEPAARLAAAGIREIADTSFMNCIHPDLFQHKARQAEMNLGFRNVVAAMAPSLKAALLRRFSRLRRSQ